jgi:hypothetical protein
MSKGIRDMSEKEQQTRDQPGQESAETQTAQQTEPVEHVEQPREPSQVQAGSMIADQLGENEEFPRQQIITMVQALGRMQARALLERALEIEANGGMLPQNNKQKGTYAAGVLQSEKSPSMPKGLPARPESKTTSVVSLGSKQCKTMAGTLTDPQDLLIIEGDPQINQETGAVAVFATCVTSKPLQAAKRERQKKESQNT